MQRDSSQEEDTEWESDEDEPLMETEKKKSNTKRRAVPYSSYSPCHKRFLTFTLPPDYFRIEQSTSDKEQQEYFKHIKKQSLYIDPSNNGDNSSKDSSPSSHNPLVTIKIRPDLLTCESVTLESIWEDGTPMIRFLRTGSNSSETKKNESVSTEVTEPKTSGSSSEIHDRFVTLTLLPEDVKAGVLSAEEDCLEAYGIELDSEEASNQDEKPRLLWKASTSSPSQKKPRSLWKASTSSPSQNLFLTLTLKISDVKNSRLVCCRIPVLGSVSVELTSVENTLISRSLNISQKQPKVEVDKETLKGNEVRGGNKSQNRPLE
ncbi:hypothetical protein YC2023_111448 [Brassica napus]